MRDWVRRQWQWQCRGRGGYESIPSLKSLLSIPSLKSLLSNLCCSWPYYWPKTLYTHACVCTVFGRHSFIFSFSNPASDTLHKWEKGSWVATKDIIHTYATTYISCLWSQHNSFFFSLVERAAGRIRFINLNPAAGWTKFCPGPDFGHACSKVRVVDFQHGGTTTRCTILCVNLTKKAGAVAVGTLGILKFAIFSIRLCVWKDFNAF